MIKAYARKAGYDVWELVVMSPVPECPGLERHHVEAASRDGSAILAAARLIGVKLIPIEEAYEHIANVTRVG